MYVFRSRPAANYENANGVITAEEPPTAILYAHAAFLSESKRSRRRAALWYLVAAEKLEKTGIVRRLAKLGLLFDRMTDVHCPETPGDVLLPQSA